MLASEVTKNVISFNRKTSELSHIYYVFVQIYNWPMVVERRENIRTASWKKRKRKHEICRPRVIASRAITWTKSDVGHIELRKVAFWKRLMFHFITVQSYCRDEIWQMNLKEKRSCHYGPLGKLSWRKFGFYLCVQRNARMRRQAVKPPNSCKEKMKFNHIKRFSYHVSVMRLDAYC